MGGLADGGGGGGGFMWHSGGWQPPGSVGGFATLAVGGGGEDAVLLVGGGGGGGGGFMWHSGGWQPLGSLGAQAGATTAVTITDAASARWKERRGFVGARRMTRELTLGYQRHVKLIVNGEHRELRDGATVADLVRELALPGPVAVERNQDIVPRREHATTHLADGDVVEVVHFVGGG